jgi:hypothetical protein
MSRRRPILRVKLNYKFDAFLLHLVQELTKRPSAEILNFFNELSKQVCEIGAENRTGRGIRKNISDYFPGTSIPFHMQVKGYPRHDYDSEKKEYISPEYMSCHVEVGFPERKMYIKSQKLDDIAVALMEKALLGGDEVNIAPFIRPEIRTPKMYKSLMDAYTGRPAPESKKEKKEGEDG